MKRLFILLAILSVSVLFSGCTSVSAKGSSAKISVEHEIKYSNKGTRSEGRSGYLKINGTVIPDCFSTVVADSRVFAFKTKSTMWGDDGYFPFEGASAESVYPNIDRKVSDADIARGWREVAGRCGNVPETWIFVKWDGGSAAVSPEKTGELVKTKSLRQIRRNSMFDNLIMEKNNYKVNQ